MDEQSNFTFDTGNTTPYYDDYEENIDHTYAGCHEQYCDSTSSSHYDYKYCIDGIFLFIVAIIGVTGTLMSINVLFKPELQNPFTKLLTVLCMFDCAFLIMGILYTSLPAISCW